MKQIDTLTDNVDNLIFLKTQAAAPIAESKSKKEESKRQKRKSNTSKFICPYCNREAVLIWVHGHYQCQKCKTVVESCCEPY